MSGDIYYSEFPKPMRMLSANDAFLMDPVEQLRHLERELERTRPERVVLKLGDTTRA